MYRNILVAVDGSPSSELALCEALKFSDGGAQLTVVTVVDNPLVVYDHNSPYFSGFNFAAAHTEFIQEAEMILEDAVEDAERMAAVKVKTRLIDLGLKASHREIASAIEQAAKDAHADLIVLGTHGRMGAKRFFMGSIAEQVVRQSHFPVLLVRDQNADRLG